MKNEFYLHFDGGLPMRKEEWKKIEKFPQYSVSDFGRVRNDKTGNILKPFCVGNKNHQYYAVDFYPIKNRKIHRLVAEAFIPNPEHKREVNHKDGNHFNNAAENLEWVSGSENCIHAYRVLGKVRLSGSLNSRSRKIIRVEDGKVYGSVSEATSENGLKAHTSIVKAINRDNRTAGGYHWVFKNCK